MLYEVITPSVLTTLDLKGKKIGVLTDVGCGEAATPEVAALIKQAAEVFAGLGADVVDMPPPLDFDFLNDMRIYFSVKAGMERDSRITSYNVCYTKLLRY